MTASLPPELADYDRELAHAIGDQIDARRRRRRRMAAPATLCVTGAAAGAAIVAVGLGSSGTALSPQPASAAVLRGAVRALADPAGSILHVVMTETRPAYSSGTMTDTRSVWMLPAPAGHPCELNECPAQDLRENYQLKGSSLDVDSSTNPEGLTTLYDSSSNTIYQPPNLRSSWQVPHPIDGQNLTAMNPFSTAFGRELQRAIASGRAHVAGQSTVNGIAVEEIAGETDVCNPPGQPLPTGLKALPSRGGRACAQLSTWTYDVTAAGYHPVSLVNTIPGSGNDTMTFDTWQTLPAAANMDVFSLADQYPGAATDRSAAGYASESARFDTAENVSSQATETFIPAGN
jgi:hypothetical protein